MSTDLFSPVTIGALTLPNRIAMAPMTRSRATADHTPTPIMAEHYAARADGGLLITEGTAPDPNGSGYPRIPGLWSDEQVAGWTVVTDAVHADGGHIAVQLMHTGRVGHSSNMPAGAEILAPSAVQAPGEMYTDQQGPQPHPTPRAMTEGEVEEAIEGFVNAARNAIAAGFDAVELHGANGYLIDQFLSPNTNLRQDQWGGDIEGRGRFAMQVARRVAEAIGADRLGIRLSPFGVFGGIQPWDAVASDFVWLAGQLGALGLAWMHIVDHSSMGAPAVPEPVKASIREAFGGSVILSGGYDRERADADLAAGKGALVAFGRPFIANPDLVTRLRTGAPLTEPDFGTFYSPGPKGYNDYPRLDQAPSAR
jgi:N-ethylmaleimide reductase